MLFNKWTKMDENSGDDGLGGKGGAGGAGDSKVPADHTQQIELLTKSVGMLAEGLQRMEGSQASVMDVLAKLSDRPLDMKPSNDPDTSDTIDVEQLDRKQFAEYILKNTAKSLRTEMTKLLGDVDAKVASLATNFEAKNAREQIDKTASSNPDFWEWSNEIKGILKENPTLSVSRAYALVKAENPTKAKELGTKYDKPAAKKEQSFIGLTPTSMVGTREGTGKMTQKEAAEKAFDKIMGELGDVINSGDMKIA